MTAITGTGVPGGPARDRSATASDRTYSFVKNAILAGDYVGGTLISEGEVAAAIEVSRTPVREAFLRLAAEGLLLLYPKRGALVVPVSASEIHDVLDARLVIERHAADMVIASGRNRRLAGQMRAMLEQDLPAGAAASADLDRRFHAALVAEAGNRLLSSFYDSLRDRQLRMATAALLQNPERHRAVQAEHAALANLIEAGDSAAVTAALSRHLEATRAAVAGG